MGFFSSLFGSNSNSNKSNNKVEVEKPWKDDEELRLKVIEDQEKSREKYLSGDLKISSINFTFNNQIRVSQQAAFIINSVETKDLSHMTIQSNGYKDVTEMFTLELLGHIAWLAKIDNEPLSEETIKAIGKITTPFEMTSDLFEEAFQVTLTNRQPYTIRGPILPTVYMLMETGINNTKNPVLDPIRNASFIANLYDTYRDVSVGVIEEAVKDKDKAYDENAKVLFEIAKIGNIQGTDVLGPHSPIIC